MTNRYPLFLEGKNDFFEAFFQEHHAALLLIAFRYMRDQDDAADVVAEVYQKLLGFLECLHLMRRF